MEKQSQRRVWKPHGAREQALGARNVEVEGGSPLKYLKAVEKRDLHYLLPRAGLALVGISVGTGRAPDRGVDWHSGVLGRGRAAASRAPSSPRLQGSGPAAAHSGHSGFWHWTLTKQSFHPGVSCLWRVRAGGVSSLWDFLAHGSR